VSGGEGREGLEEILQDLILHARVFSSSFFSFKFFEQSNGWVMLGDMLVS
jgi:hypothetical protein